LVLRVEPQAFLLERKQLQLLHALVEPLAHKAEERSVPVGLEEPQQMEASM
jgi:hypothetical protein